MNKEKNYGRAKENWGRKDKIEIGERKTKIL